MTDSHAAVDSSLPGAISDSLAFVWREQTGRKPPAARTYISEDLVVCLLQGGMSPYEKQLINEEENPAVWTMREHMRIGVETDEVAEVERLTGRRVVSFLSDHDTGSDLAAELFVLERVPSAATGPKASRGVDSVVDDLEATMTELEQALGAVNVRLNEIERRADRTEGAAVAAVEDLERKLGELGVLRDTGTGTR